MSFPAEASLQAVPATPAENPMLFVQAIKGAPASVLLALAFAGRQMTHLELQLWTRCGHAQITLALKSLVALGWVLGRSSRGPWALAPDRRRQVFSFFSGASALKALNDDDDSDTPVNEETSSSNARREQLRKVLDGYGVEEPTATELAELPHMDEAYVAAHVRAVKARGLNLGLAILRMRMGAAPPAVAVPQTRQAVVEEKIRRFREGP